MSKPKSCEACDKPIATDADDLRCPGGCRCEHCMSLCWRRWNSGEVCGEEPADWRKRALDAEAKAQTLNEVTQAALKWHHSKTWSSQDTALADLRVALAKVDL